MASKNKAQRTGGSVSELTEPAPDILSVMGEGFISKDDLKAITPEGVVVNSMAPIIKPSQFPVGKVLVGVLKSIFKTKEFERAGGKQQGFGVEIIPHGRPVGLALPVVATLKHSLKIEEKDGEASCPYIGRTIAVELMPSRIASKKGNDAWHFVVAVFPENYEPKQIVG